MEQVIEEGKARLAAGQPAAIQISGRWGRKLRAVQIKARRKNQAPRQSRRSLARHGVMVGARRYKCRGPMKLWHKDHYATGTFRLAQWCRRVIFLPSNPLREREDHTQTVQRQQTIQRHYDDVVSNLGI
jgi:hypothetical protein